MGEHQLATAQEAARFYRVTQRTIRNWCASGALPAARVGGSGPWRIDTSGQLRDLDTSVRGERPDTGRLR